MGEVTKPKPVKLFTGLLTGKPDILTGVESELEDEFGRIDLESQLMPFDFTDYYREEMGKGIKRKFVSFKDLVDPGELPHFKRLTNEMEVRFTGKSDLDLARPINIDPGYLGMSKVVLATTKNYSHRLYLKDGIYGEVTLQYRDGEFRPQDWTYPDYRTEEYLEFFEKVRDRYCNQID